MFTNVKSLCTGDKSSRHRPGLAWLILAAAWGLPPHTASADPPSGRVVVVRPNQGQQPLGPNERVTAATTVVINGEPTTVVRVEQFPIKPKFVVGMPVGFPPGAMMFFPFPQDHVDNGITVGKRAYVAPGGGVTVVSYSCNAAGITCEGNKMVFPPGSVLIPDPPQPPGLMFAAATAPVDPQTEAAVLAAIGQPDLPQTEVWLIPTGDLFFFIQGSPPGPPVLVRPAAQPGDLNCDGNVDGLDVEGFVSALLDAAAYTASRPDCGYFHADVNGDEVVNTLDVSPFIHLLLAQ